LKKIGKIVGNVCIMSEESKLPLKHRFYLWLGSHVAGKLIRLLKKTVRLTVIGDEHLRSLMENGGRAILAFWHGNMIIPMMRHIDEGDVVLVSEHGDGEIIARALKSLGYDLIRGSTTHSGAKALVDMRKRFESPGIIAITPDGPKGPYRELKSGAVILAKQTGVPILPISAYTNRPKFLKSWDRFHLVKPFVKCVLMYGKPIKIERDLSSEKLEEKRRFVEQAIYELDRQAETFFDAD